MTTTLPSRKTNPHIEALQTVFDNSATTIEWLIITHNAPQLVRSLEAALSGCSAAVLQLSEDTWEFRDSELTEGIHWALQRSGIRNLVLVGHSHASGNQTRASLVAPCLEVEGELQNSYSRLVSGARLTSSRNQNTQRRFALQFQQMSKIPMVQDRLSSGELALYGLLYRAEDGLFLAYEAESEGFHPLMR